MNMRQFSCAVVTVTLLSIAYPGYSDPVSANVIGVGTRAYSLANNYVALSNDLSGAYWNPAALSFLPIREFQAGMDILQNRNTTDLAGYKEDARIRRPRLSSIGLLTSLPASRGGLTFAGSIQTPVIFDESKYFNGSYVNGEGQGVFASQEYKGHGGLTYISGSCGLQVAPGFGVGATVSLILGSETIYQKFFRTVDGVVPPLTDSTDDNFILNSGFDYTGYDLRFGLFYTPTERIRFGMRLCMPQKIWFTDELSIVNPDSNWEDRSQPTGQLYSSYSGAVGVAVRLPFLTASSELRARAPYDIIFIDEKIMPSSNPALKVKMGAGVGVEAPVFNSKVVARAGYSWDQYDPFPYVRKYDNDNYDIWSTNNRTATKDLSLITAGLGYVDSKWSLEGAYGYQAWTLETQREATLVEKHNQHRVALSFSVHY